MITLNILGCLWKKKNYFPILGHLKSFMSDSLQPLGCSPPGFCFHGISQARILEWVAISFSGDLPYPGIEPWSPALQAHCLPSEPPGNISVHIGLFIFFSFANDFVRINSENVHYLGKMSELFSDSVCIALGFISGNLCIN